MILEYFSGGIEHGHVHFHKGQSLPWALFISLSVHSIIEGLPLGNEYAGIVSEHHHVHESLLWGIIFHQVPVSIALMTLLMNTKLSLIQSWLFLFGRSERNVMTYKIVFCLFTVLGASISLGAVTDFSDAMIFAMAIPNLIGVSLLLPKVKEELVKYRDAIKASKS